MGGSNLSFYSGYHLSLQATFPFVSSREVEERWKKIIFSRGR